jgi:hypothetical protein
MTVATFVYLLCALTSGTCMLLLWRGYRQSRARLLWWSTLCFAGLFLNNFLLVLDLRVLTAIDLSIVRTVPAVLGVACLLYGFLWEGQ